MMIMELIPTCTVDDNKKALCLFSLDLQYHSFVTIEPLKSHQLAMERETHWGPGPDTHPFETVGSSSRLLGGVESRHFNIDDSYQENGDKETEPWLGMIINCFGGCSSPTSLSMWRGQCWACIAILSYYNISHIFTYQITCFSPFSRLRVGKTMQFWGWIIWVRQPHIPCWWKRS